MAESVPLTTTQPHSTILAQKASQKKHHRRSREERDVMTRRPPPTWSLFLPPSARLRVPWTRKTRAFLWWRQGHLSWTLAPPRWASWARRSWRGCGGIREGRSKNRVINARDGMATEKKQKWDEQRANSGLHRRSEPGARRALPFEEQTGRYADQDTCEAPVPTQAAITQGCCAHEVLSVNHWGRGARRVRQEYWPQLGVHCGTWGKIYNARRAYMKVDEAATRNGDGALLDPDDLIYEGPKDCGNRQVKIPHSPLPPRPDTAIRNRREACAWDAQQDDTPRQATAWRPSSHSPVVPRRC